MEVTLQNVADRICFLSDRALKQVKYLTLLRGDLCFFAQVKDDKNKCTLGSLMVPLSSLLVEEDMTLTQCFPLKNSGPSSTIKLKMALRVKTG